MIFVIDNLKYDTNKMTLITTKCKYWYTCHSIFDDEECYNECKDVKLWKSIHGRWLITYTKGYSTIHAEALTKEKASDLLKKYDINKYEEIFGELEEA